MSLNKASQKSVILGNKLRKEKIKTLEDYKKHEADYLGTMALPGNESFIFKLAELYINAADLATTIAQSQKYLYYAFEYYKMYIWRSYISNNQSKKHMMTALDHLINYYEHHIHTKESYKYLDFDKNIIPIRLVCYKYLKFYNTPDTGSEKIALLKEITPVLKSIKLIDITKSIKDISNYANVLKYLSENGKTILNKNHPSL